MANKHIHILFFLTIYYAAPVFFQIYFGLDVSPLGLLLKLPAFLFVGLMCLWIIHNKTKIKFLNTFQIKKTNWLKVISYSFLILAILYFLKSLGNVTYVRQFPNSPIQSEIINSLSYIVSKPLLALILVGPFVWLNVLFIESSRAYLHTYLNSISKNKTLILLSIIIIPLLLSSMKIDDSPSQFINLFVTNLTLSIAFILLNDMKPIVLASIMYQSIDLIALWIYS
jgi:hypothetical protein